MDSFIATCSSDSGVPFYAPGAAFVSSVLFIGDGGKNLVHTTGYEGYYQVGVGFRCMTNLTTGSYNTGVGFEVMESTTTGSYNTAFGEACLIYNITGNGNTSLGWKAKIGIPPSSGGAGNGNYNTCLGYSAGITLDSGSNNLLVGANAGAGLTTGSNNVVVGNYGLAPNSQNTIIIADGAGHARIVADQYSFRVFDQNTANQNFAVCDNGTLLPRAFAVAALPASTPGAMTYVSNGRNPGEGAGAGSGCLATVNVHGVWAAVWSGTQVLA